MSMGDTDWRPSVRMIAECKHSSISSVARDALQMNYNDFKTFCDVIEADPDKVWAGLQGLIK